jgi:hypothetical protein
VDILFFLKRRTEFIRYFYDTGGEPFRDIIRRIESGISPFNECQDGQDEEEPPFQTEWSEATTALESLGRSCISMLSASLSLYFNAWETEMRITWCPKERAKLFKRGVKAYLEVLGETLKFSPDECSVNFDIVDQVILARNRDQHPDSIATLSVAHDRRTLDRYTQVFFISETEQKIYSDPEMRAISWMSPAVYVSRETLFSAIDQVEALADWLEERRS